MSLTNRPKRYDIMRGRGPAGAQGIPHQKPKSHQLQEVHAVQPSGVYPLGEGYFEAGERPDPQYQGRGRKVQ